MLFAIILISTYDTLTVHYAEGIKIDGNVEVQWYQADSTLVYRQFSPYYDSISTYRTVVKCLQDKGNLYFLFDIHTGGEQPIVKLAGAEDRVTVYIDPMDSKVMAYGFSVTASNQRLDWLVLDDGRWSDYTWAGVWESATRVYRNGTDNRLVIEIKIPFKTLRFRNDIADWGVQFRVYFQRYKETNYWVLPDQREGLRVSQFGTLTNVKPTVVGYGTEIYPVGLTKHTLYREEKKTIPWVGLDITWKISPSLTLNVTGWPDFAEIESDPFKMSLSKYEIYYSERRPFFLEGKEIFEPAGFGIVKPFYSRRVGRRMRDGTGEVPILGGLKLTGKTRRWEFGLLSAYTGDKFGDWDTAYATLWNVLRYKHYIFTNSELGGMLATRMDKSSSYYVVDVDGSLRSTHDNLTYQVVGNLSHSSAGIFVSCRGEKRLSQEYTVFMQSTYTGEGFDISPLGYATTFAGDRSIFLFIHRMKFISKGNLDRWSYGLGYSSNKEANEPWCHAMYLNGYLGFRKPFPIRVNLSIGGGRSYESGTYFWSKSLNWNIGLKPKQYSFWIGGYYGYGWNYRRNLLAWQGTLQFSAYVPFFERFSLNPFGNLWVELNPHGKLLQVTMTASIHFDIIITPYMDVTIAANPVAVYEDGKLQLTQERISLFYSWEFKPKSKFYLVWNTLYAQDGNGWQPIEQIAAIKLRWLFLF